MWCPSVAHWQVGKAIFVVKLVLPTRTHDIKTYLNWKKLAKIDETLWHIDLKLVREPTLTSLVGIIQRNDKTLMGWVVNFQFLITWVDD